MPPYQVGVRAKPLVGLQPVGVALLELYLPEEALLMHVANPSITKLPGYPT